MAMQASSSSGLSREEALALVIALAAHAAVIAALTLAPPGKSIQPIPERMTVTIADEVADQSTSPDPNAEAAPDVAPMLGEPQPDRAPPQIAQPMPPPPAQIPQARPQPIPQPAVRPVPAPQPRAVQAPPKPQAPPPKPAAKPAQPTATPAAPADPRLRRRPDTPSGASRLGSDFLRGIASGTQPAATGNPASALSAEAKAAVRVSINARVLPPWNSCPVNGLDIEKLRARVSFQLDRSGNIVSVSPPQISGKTDANAPQVARFSECAVRAVRTAAPFSLPADSYDFWKSYTLNFSKKE
jgi:outer membrane biosynthesis protein TonB